MIDQEKLNDLKYTAEQLEKMALEESRTSVFKLHLKLTDVIKYLESLNGESNENQSNS